MSAASVRLATARGLLLVTGTRAADAQSLDWVRQAGGPDLDQPRGVAVDAAGNSYVTGIFGKPDGCSFCARPAIFGAGSPNETTLTSVDFTQDIFVAKYDNRGVLQWAKAGDASGTDEAERSVVDE